jgi:HK97 family phage major capsid protein
MSSPLELRIERRAISVQMTAALERNDLPEWHKLDSIQENLREKIEAMERSSALNTELNTVRNADRPNIGDPESFGNDGPTTQRVRGPHYEARSTKAYAREFDNFLRTGERGPEMRAVGVGGDGATLVPVGFEAELEIKMKYWGGLANICRTLTTPTGNPLHYPTLDDTSNSGEWLAEAGGVGSADPTFSEVVFGANLLSSKQVKVSVQLEQDSAFDMSGLLSDAFGERLGRALDTALWTGDGSTIPITGLLTALEAAGGRSVPAVGANANSGNSADTDLNTIGTDDFSALIDKLDRAYQKPTNKFVFNQSTQNSLRKMKDKYGRPVWEVSLAQGNPDTIFGFGFTVDNALANIGAGNVSAAFGDPSKYVIRRALGFTLVRFAELYMANFQRAYQAFMRVDAKLLQPAAWSYLIHPDS